MKIRINAMLGFVCIMALVPLTVHSMQRKIELQKEKDAQQRRDRETARSRKAITAQTVPASTPAPTPTQIAPVMPQEPLAAGTQAREQSKAQAEQAEIEKEQESWQPDLTKTFNENLESFARVLYMIMQQGWERGLQLEDINIPEGSRRLQNLLSRAIAGADWNNDFLDLVATTFLRDKDAELEMLMARAIKYYGDIDMQQIHLDLLRPIFMIISQDKNKLFKWSLMPIIASDSVMITLKTYTQRVNQSMLGKQRWISSFRVLVDDLQRTAPLPLPPDHALFASEITQDYKIHLMPRVDFVDMVFLKLAQLITQDRALQQHISAFKIKCNDYATLKKQGNIPKIVVYIEKGKEAAQYVLDKLHRELANFPAHTEYAPCYNEKVTDLIWFAQGDNDAKAWYPLLFEKGDDVSFTGKVYYRPDLTPEGANNGYHLVNPETFGQERLATTQREVAQSRQAEQGRRAAAGQSQRPQVAAGKPDLRKQVLVTQAAKVALLQTPSAPHDDSMELLKNIYAAVFCA